MAWYKILLFIILIPALSAKAQSNVQGKWYSFTRNWVIELTITPDKYISKQIDWDLTDRRFRKMDALSIMHVTEANGNVYLSINPPGDTSGHLIVITITVVEPGKKLMFAVNGNDDPFPDATAVSKYIGQDLGKKYGLSFFSEGEIRRLQKQKNIEDMTAEDYATYNKRVNQFTARLDSLSKLPEKPSGMLVWGYSGLREIIGEMGYNPLVDAEAFDTLAKKFGY